MAKRARLDRDLVYEGPEEVGEFGKDDIQAPDECIRPGAYRWQPATDSDIGHWVPLTGHQVKAGSGVPSLEQAFFDFVRAAETNLPPRTAAWCAAFQKTREGNG